MGGRGNVPRPAPSGNLIGRAAARQGTPHPEKMDSASREAPEPAPGAPPAPIALPRRCPLMGMGGFGATPTWPATSYSSHGYLGAVSRHEKSAPCWAPPAGAAGPAGCPAFRVDTYFPSVIQGIPPFTVCPSTNLDIARRTFRMTNPDIGPHRRPLNVSQHVVVAGATMAAPDQSSAGRPSRLGGRPNGFITSVRVSYSSGRSAAAAVGPSGLDRLPAGAPRETREAGNLGWNAAEQAGELGNFPGSIGRSTPCAFGRIGVN